MYKPKPGFDPSEVPARFVNTVSALRDLGDEIADADAVAVDTETYGPDVFHDTGLWCNLRVISVAARFGEPESGHYIKAVIDVRDLPVEDVARFARRIKLAIGWNANFDDRVLRTYGAPVAKWRDGMLDETILWAGTPGRGWWLGLAVAANRYLGYEMSGKGTTQTSFDGSTDLTQEQIDYAADDALITLRVDEAVRGQLAVHGLVTAADLEQGARPFIAQMMEEGYPFQIDKWLDMVNGKRADELRALYKIACVTGTPDSPRDVLRDMLDGLKDHERRGAWADKAAAVTSDDEAFEVLGIIRQVTGVERTVGDGRSAISVEEVPQPVSDGLARLAPRFKVTSDKELKPVLNRIDRDAVIARGGQLLGANDKVDKAVMQELARCGSTLAPLILEYRKATKYVTTYGRKFAQFVHKGRINARYKQALTATGRLSSTNPNAQNLPGTAKLYIAPHNPDSLLLSADYSQAELRVLAYLADEEGMAAAFRAGVDLHELTANQMFGVDIAALKASGDEGAKSAKQLRTKCKRVNFGIPYGLGAAALAQQLTNEGVPTTEEEAAELLSRYNEINPSVASWLAVRDGFMKELARNPGQIDFKASFELLKLWSAYEPMRSKFKRENKRFPTAEELADLAFPVSQQIGFFDDSDEVRQAKRDALVPKLAWAFTYDAPVVLRPGGEPLAWESRTISGRRRLFMVPMNNGYKRAESDDGSSTNTSDMFGGLITSVMLAFSNDARYRDFINDPAAFAAVRDARDAWVKQNKLELPTGSFDLRFHAKYGALPKELPEEARKFRKDERTRAVKAFEGKNKPLKEAFVRHMLMRIQPHEREALMRRCVGDQIRLQANAFRNHPIQGSVADIAEVAFAELYAMCDEFPGLRWVQSVHDSIVGECPADLAPAAGRKQKQVMEAAMVRFCKTVPAKVDAEIASNLDDSGIIERIPDEEPVAA